MFESVGLRAVGLRAQGAVSLARGEGVTALASLRAACSAWNEFDAPYEAARTRVLLADAYALLDDDDGADRGAGCGSCVLRAPRRRRRAAVPLDGGQSPEGAGHRTD